MMKLVLLIIGLLVAIANCSVGNVVLQNNKMFVDGREYFIKGVDYNPVPMGQASMDGGGFGGGGYCSPKMTPWGEWKSACYDSDFFDAGADHWSRWPPAPADGFAALWRRDFPIMQAMGTNTLRIYNANPTTRQMSQLYSNYIPFPQGKDHIPFLNMAQQYGFKVIFPLYSDMWAFTNTPEDDYKRLLRAQIDEVGNHSAVLIWQFGNEMNWDGTHLGFYPYPDLIAKYNKYAQYIRQYTLSRWGRKIPLTHAVIDYPQTFDWLMQQFDTDIFSLNTFRGTGTYSLFPGDSNTRGFAYDTCAFNKPLLITEFGFYSYAPGWANQLMSDFVSHINQGLIGVVVFEHNDENVPQKPGNQRSMGTVSVTPTYNGTQDSTQANVFMLDTVAPKQLYNDLSAGQYNNVAYNYHSDLFALAGRTPQTTSASVDYCASVGVFKNCTGGYPACGGHGICDRTTGLCACAAGWIGSGCTSASCNCSGRGACSILTSPPQCVCNTGYYGVNCENVVQATSCPNACTGGKNGVCNQNNTCTCVSGWAGHDCSILSVPVAFPGLSIGGSGLLGSYYNGTNFETYLGRRIDATINFNVGGGSFPGIPTIGSDFFSIKWTGFIVPRCSGTYTFTTVSDDGIQLFVNGINIINNWNGHAPTTDTATISLLAGTRYPIQLNYMEITGGSTITLSWSQGTCEPLAIIPRAQLFYS